MYPPIPTSRPENLYSFYEYSISPRERAHASLCGGSWGSGVWSSRAPSSSSSSSSSSSKPTPKPIRGVTPASAPKHRGLFPITTLQDLDDRRHAARRANDRVARRALRGLRAAGVALAHDAQDLSDEEEMLEREKASINAFGHRFLMPFGRMMTQMEMEAAPSPTPSDADHRQEDHNGVDIDVTPPASPDMEGDDEVDLDASIEDRDADDDDDNDGRSTEYDSDDLRLMAAMDRSVGSRTPASDEEDMDEE